MATYKTVITDEGARLIAEAVISGEPLIIAQAGVGDANGEYYVPTQSQTELRHECWRGDVAAAYTNGEYPNVIDVQVAIPADAESFTAREIALYDEDGVMIAVGNLPPTERVTADSGVTGRLTLWMHIAVQDAGAVEFNIVPSTEVMSGFSMVINAADWTELSDPENGYGWEYVLSYSPIGADMVPEVVISEDSLQTAFDAGLCQVAETFDGGLRMLSQYKPSATINARCYLIGKGFDGETLSVPEWEDVQHKPSTLAGYGITDAATLDEVTALRAAVGSPLKAATAAAMTDTDKIYVYTGSETGYTAGNWYYHNGTAWVSGGVYNAVAVATDTELVVSGMAADAKAAGDALKKAVQSSLLYIQASNTGGYSNANDFPANRIINIASNITATHVANLPSYGEASYVLTLSYNPTSAYSAQVFFGRNTTAVRMKLLSGWTTWRIEANIADVLKYAWQTTGSYASLGEVPENVISGLNFTTAGWSDAPEGAQHGILISSQVSANYKLQMVLEYGDNKHIWWRIVNRASPYGTFVDWQKTPTSAELEKALQSSGLYLQPSSLSGYTDANDFPANKIIEIASAVTASDIANLPAYGALSYVLTVTYDPTTSYSAQIYFSSTTLATRIKAVGGWQAWSIKANIADVLKYALQTTGSYASLGAVPENVISGLNFTTAGWSDAPEGAQYGILISSQVSANYKLQLVLEYGDNKRIWWRIVNRASPYGTLVDWQKTPTSAELETVQSYANKLVTSISSYMTSHNITTLAQLPENIITLASSAIEDAPFANAVFFNMRYSANFAIQFAFTLSSRQMAYRIVNRTTGVPYNDWATMNMLNPNTVLSMGDSISYGSRNDHKGFLGDIFPKAARKKAAAPGACLSNKRMTDSTTEKKRLCIYQQLLDFVNDPNNVGYAPDIIVGNGGVNDYVYGSPLGTLPTQPATDATAAEALNKATLLGGLEYLFYLMIANYPKAQRFFVLTHRTKTWPWTAGSQGYTQTQMNEAIAAVCKIYGVEVIDVFNRGMINTAFSEYISPEDYDAAGNTDEDKARITNSYYVDSDGIHPLALGYKEGYVPIVRAALGIGTSKEAAEEVEI